MKIFVRASAIIVLVCVLFNCASSVEKNESSDSSINNEVLEEKEITRVSFEGSDHPVKYSGVRSSSYGVSPFPSEQGWEYAFDKMESYFPGSQACGIWIIGNITGNNCVLQFPKPENDSTEYENIKFYSTDKHEEYLDYFDEAGIKVFLQVEPGQANMEDLITLIFNQYGDHESVIGFGVDLEWYSPDGGSGINGEDFVSSLSDDLAMKWDALVKSYNPEYRMFLKHWVWDASIMPQNTTSDIIFISDSQGFNWGFEGEKNESQRALNTMISEFTEGWAPNFRKNGNVRAIGFQIGYYSDHIFWEELLAEPYPMNFGNAILEGIPAEQEVSFFWVDFTMEDVLLTGFDGLQKL